MTDLAIIERLLNEGHKGEYAISKQLGITRHEARKGIAEYLESKGNRGAITTIPVASCRVSAAARVVKPIQVEILAKSIEQIGLIQPIVVRKVEDGYEVIAGVHRLSAFRLLARPDIPAILRDDDDLHAELALIDENLVRNELTAAERAIAISRRKAIYEVLHPATTHGGDRKSTRQLGDLIDPPQNDDAERFTKATADVINRSERSIQRDAARGETIGQEALSRVVDTSLDSGEELDALAKLQPEHRERLIERAAAGEVVSAKAGDGALPNGARAIMNNRKEPDDSLDFFPTPPWATRALIEQVIGGVLQHDVSRKTAWDPASGEGHMTHALRPYFAAVTSTDVHAYGHEQDAVVDFLTWDFSADKPRDWIITNPPFGNKTEQFVLRALDLAKVGVAMFVRLQWLETIGRYETIFKDHPPTIIAFFAERVNLRKDYWEPNGGTATAYIWLVWVKGRTPQAPFWIPPGQREALTYPEDIARFTPSIDEAEQPQREAAE